MSRLAFRTALETPRPRSAIVLVLLASVTLAITGQVALPVLALQAVAIAVAAWRRGAPWSWQLRGLWLNAGLAGSAVFALAEAVRGAPSSVALAQFALLASGLQLLDARPRRSEFLLVALSLFQVVLASSLTDSLFFPPLLMAFLPTCVWTLLVHTLRSEAQEAGDPAAAGEAITPGLLGMTLAASAVSLALALVLFFLLPRMHEGLVHGSGTASHATSGFSERVTLGDLGRIRGDPTIMLRVQTLEGKAPPQERSYWRGLAFDRFDGHAWSIAEPDRTAVEGDPTRGILLGGLRDTPDLRQRILREPMPSGVLFGIGDPVWIEGGTGRLERDRNGGLYAPQSAEARIRYDLFARTETPSDAALAQDEAQPPDDGGRSLSLPPLAPEIAERARAITEGSTDDLGRARALERWLRRNGRYSDTPPHEDPGDPRSPLERFLLGELRGHCEYFASAMVVMARSVGLPARLVNGFAGGRQNDVGGFVELTGSDAHAWVEIHFRDHGWVRFDPTPPDLRLAAAGSRGSLWDRLEDLQSALELAWFQHVVEFDRSSQVSAAVGAWRTLQAWLPHDRSGAVRPASADWLARLRELPWPAAGASVAILGAAAWIGLRRSRARRAVEAALPRSYARALRLLARRGFVRPPARTPREFARELARRLPPAGALAFASLTESYLYERYGGRAVQNPDAGRTAQADEDALRTLRDSLRR